MKLKKKGIPASKPVKKEGRGGKRKGAGRPATGVNTISRTFVIPKIGFDATVAKIKALIQQEKQAIGSAPVKKQPKEVKKKPETPDIYKAKPPVVAQKQSSTGVSDYLAKRRQLKNTGK